MKLLAPRSAACWQLYTYLHLQGWEGAQNGAKRVSIHMTWRFTRKFAGRKVLVKDMVTIPLFSAFPIHGRGWLSLGSAFWMQNCFKACQGLPRLAGLQLEAATGSVLRVLEWSSNCIWPLRWVSGFQMLGTWSIEVPCLGERLS